MKRLEATVIGKVQGVYFRASTKKVAKTLNLVGYVKNQLDGSVFLEAQGEEEDLETLVKWLKKGPSNAEVFDVRCEYLEELEQYNKFEILR
ncbi:MAG: acylphosphatase [Sphingobacteriales bacterium]|jgi:acylphosphatase